MHYKRVGLLLLLFVVFCSNPIFANETSNSGWKNLTPNGFEQLDPGKISSQQDKDWQKSLKVAITLWSQKRYEEAESILTSTLQTEEVKSDNTAKSQILGFLGAVYRGENRYSEAISAFQQSFDLEKASAHPNDVSLGTTLNNMAESYRAIGQFESALPLLQEAAKMINQQSPGYASLMQNFGLVYRGLGRNTDAENAFINAYKASRFGPYPSSAETIESSYSLSLLFKQERKTDQTIALLDEVIPMAISTWGMDNSKTKELIYQYEVLLQTMPYVAKWREQYIAGCEAVKRQNYVGAAQHFSQALQYADRDNPGSFFVATTLSQLGMAYVMLGDDAKAEPILIKALPLMRKQFVLYDADISMVEKAISKIKIKNSNHSKKK